jgi:hypothetical protein
MNPTAVLSSPWLLCRRQFVGRHRLLQCYRRITAGSRKEVASIYLKLHEPSMAGRMGQGAAETAVGSIKNALSTFRERTATSVR